jgi:hypothetical protein
MPDFIIGNGLTLYARFHNFISAMHIWTPEIGSMQAPEQSKNSHLSSLKTVTGIEQGTVNN